MGAGLYFPQNAPEGAARAVYVEPFNGIDLEQDQYLIMDEKHDLYDQFLEDLADCLPKSFRRVWERRWLPNNERVVAENGQFVITLHEDSYSRLHVAVQVRPNLVNAGYDDEIRLYPLALHNLDRTAEKIFDELHAQYPCRVRDGAWMSVPYVPREQPQCPPKAA